jgi:6-phosphogluconate dehydrogenase
MELIAETYDLMKRRLRLTNDELHDVYDKWNQGELKSYLMEITANVFSQKDERTDKRLVDMILDQAKQKGTGKWTSWDSMDLQVPTPTIDVAVVMRDLSGDKAERKAASTVLRGPSPAFKGDKKRFIDQLEKALYAGMIVTYAQGMALLKKASETNGYGLNLEAVARIWRGGCIIRAALLKDFRAAYQARPDLPNLLMDPRLAQEVVLRQDDLRTVISMAVKRGIPVPGLMTTLGYYDGYRSPWLPANLI